MKKFLFLLFISFSVIPLLHAQDCSSLLLTVVNKSNYNNYNVTCSGAQNGSIEVSAAGGIGPYMYSINDFDFSSTGIFVNLAAGNHTLTVSDANSCKKQLVVNLTEPPVLVGVAIVSSDLICTGSNDGIITATATGGVIPYTYSLIDYPGNTTGSVSGIFSNLSGGLHAIDITDNNGCHVMTQTISVDSPDPLYVTAAITSNYNGQQVSCNGASNGAVTVTAIGGTGGYVFSLAEMPANTSGATSGVFNGLSVGSYTATVKDINNCSATGAPLIIVEPSMISGSVIGTPTNCFGKSNGTLTTLASGGTGAYSYMLIQEPSNTSGVVSGMFTGLAAETYNVIIRDVNNCVHTTAPYIINQPAAISIETTISEGTPQNCSDATITAVASGGAGSYSYATNDTENFSGVFNGLANGTYIVLVTDANGCEREASPIIISQSSPLIVTATVTSNYNGAMVSCFGLSDGAITVTATGGTGLTFQSIEAPENPTGTSSGIFTGLGAGNYTFNVQDENNCTKETIPVVITSPSAVTIAATVTSDYNGAQVSCFNSADGEVTLTAEGGVAPYFYSLTELPNTSGAMTGIFTGLPGGNYTFSLRDQNNCAAVTSTIALISPDEIELQSEISPDENEDGGSVELTVTGGTMPYSYLWNNESTLQDLLDVSSGEYSVEVTDANDCSLEGNFIVPLITGLTELNEIFFDLIYDISWGGFYFSYELHKPTHVSVWLYNPDGSLQYSTKAHEQSGIHQYPISKQLKPGLYIAQLKMNDRLYSRKFIIHY